MFLVKIYMYMLYHTFLRIDRVISKAIIIKYFNIYMIHKRLVRG